MKYIDLHLHSNFSDGTLSPSEIVFHAADLGLSAIALTDHDTVSGVPEALSAALSMEPEDRITVIPGAEITAGYLGRDIHILGLFLDYRHSALNQALDETVRLRDLRNEKMAENLRRAGIPVTVEALREMEPRTVITRAHFARFMTMHGYVRSNQEAFDKYLGSDTPYYVKREYLEPANVIRLIHEAGGLAVLAHPLLYRYSLENTEILIARMKELGLDGLEVIYSSNTGFDEGYLRRFANRYDLVMTGGSDFHGSNKPQLEIGIGKGNLKVPETLLEPLKERLRR